MSRPIQENKNSKILQLNPKGEALDETLTMSERVERYEAAMELAVERIHDLEQERDTRARQIDPDALPLTDWWFEHVARARKALAKARGHDGDTFNRTEVPGLLKAHGHMALHLLMYPPFAAAFGAYIIHADKVEVEKTLRSLYKKFHRWRSSFLRASRVLEESWSGKTVAAIARDEDVSVPTVGKLFSKVKCEARAAARYAGMSFSMTSPLAKRKKSNKKGKREKK